MESKYAQTLLEYLKSKQVKDPLFFQDVQLDEESGRMMNFFWADGHGTLYNFLFVTGTVTHM
jgi:prepilin-type processing-associated H-X9-DG protein